MKKTALFSLFFILLSMVACTNNDAIAEPVTQNDISGIWDVSEFYIDNGTASAYIDGQLITTSYSAYGSDFNMTAQFDENPNNFSTSGYFTFNGTFSYVNEQITSEEIVDFIPEYLPSASWSLQENTLSLSTQDEQLIADIIYFENDTLRLKTTATESVLQQIDSISNHQVDSLRINANIYLTLTK